MSMSTHQPMRQAASPRLSPRQWRDRPLRELIDHITLTHHAFTRDALAFLGQAMPAVLRAHRERHPELVAIARDLDALGADLQPHLLKEERILFPFVVALEHAVNVGEPAPFLPFGRMENPIRMMLSEHDAVGELLEELRSLTRDYAVPEDASDNYRDLLNRLEALDGDLVQHIVLENEALFPRALALDP